MKKILPFIMMCCALLVVNKSYAQLGMGFNYHQSIPLGTYSDNLHKNPAGFLMTALGKTNKNKNLSFGGEFGVAMYANDEYLYELPTGESAGEIVEMYEEDCFLTYNAIARYTFNDAAKFTPYVQATVGGLSFFSTRMSDEYEDFYESTTKFHGTSLMAGLGAGATYRVHPQVVLDASIGYSRGTAAEYRSIEEGVASFRRGLDYGKYNSTVSTLNIKVGVLCGF